MRLPAWERHDALYDILQRGVHAVWLTSQILPLFNLSRASVSPVRSFCFHLSSGDAFCSFLSIHDFRSMRALDGIDILRFFVPSS